MIKIPIETIECALPVEVKKNFSTVGIDTASRTGICLAKSGTKYIHLDFSFLEMKSKNKYHKYNTLIEHMKNFFGAHKIDKIVVEETFFSRNAKVFQFLSRIGGMVYTVAHLIDIDEKEFLTATESRKRLQLPCNKKKEVVHKAFHKLIPTVKIKDIDIIDAIILALNGLIEPKSLI